MAKTFLFSILIRKETAGIHSFGCWTRASTSEIGATEEERDWWNGGYGRYGQRKGSSLEF